MKKLQIILNPDQLDVLIDVLEWQAKSDYGDKLLQACALTLWDRLWKKSNVAEKQKIKLTNWEAITISKATLNYRMIRSRNMAYLENSITGGLLLLTDQALA